MPTATSDYKPLPTSADDDDVHHFSDAECGMVSGEVNAECWEVYPGNRRTFMVEDERDDDMFFVRTGGNALQAIPKDSVRQQRTMIRVVVPEGTHPGGDEILVACPFVVTTTGNGGLISVTIPPGTTAGSVLLIEVPVVTPKVVVMGVPVDSPQEESPTPMVRGADFFEAADLALQEECEDERQPYYHYYHDQSRMQQGATCISALDEQECEMTEKREIV
jgi:hypothetical protein